MNQVLQHAENDIAQKLGMASSHRANMYQLMAKAVQYPTIELAESLLNGKLLAEVSEVVEWVNKRDGMYREALEKLEAVAKNQAGEDAQGLLQKMEVEYTRLFLQPGQAVVSPYERDYSEKEKETILASIEKAYNQINPAIFSNHPASPDHITSELKYLSYLGQQEGEAWLANNMEDAKKWKITERTFIVHHLRQWGISFFVNMERAAKLEAYNAIASAGKVFMTLEHGN